MMTHSLFLEDFMMAIQSTTMYQQLLQTSLNSTLSFSIKDTDFL